MNEIKKAVFLCDGNNIFNVFDENTLKVIRTRFEISDEVITYNSMEQNREILADAEYIFSSWGMPSLTIEEIKEFLPNLKAVFYGAGTVKSFAKPFFDADVRVFSSWGANAIPVAEFTVAQILLASKGVLQQLSIYREQGHYSAAEYSSSFPGNYNTKVGLLGFGMIGRHVATLLKNFSLDLLVYDPYVSDEVMSSYVVKKSELSHIFSECQVISNHTANIAENIGMFNYELFSKMLPNATFINTGRGAQVNEEDLVNAMIACPNRTAILDVTFPEPPKPDSRLLNCPNIFITPHVAGSMCNELARMGLFMQQEAFNLLDGKKTVYEVVEKMLERMA